MGVNPLTHLTLLADRRRMQAFEKAIVQTVRKDDAIIDLGAGTGILGFLALKHGAKNLVSIDETDTIHLAKGLAKLNGLDSRTQFINKNSLSADVSTKGDVLLVELIGDAVLNENILKCVADAKKRLLKRNPRIIPARLTLFMAPYYSHASAKLATLKRFHGMDLSQLADCCSNTIDFLKRRPDPSKLNPVKMFEVDFQRMFKPERVTSARKIRVKRGGRFNGFALWFGAELARGVVLNSLLQRTHWGVCFLPFGRSIDLRTGETVGVSINIGEGLGYTWSFTYGKGDRACTITRSSLLDPVELARSARLNPNARLPFSAKANNTLLVLSYAKKGLSLDQAAYKVRHSDPAAFPTKEAARQFTKKVITDLMD